MAPHASAVLGVGLLVLVLMAVLVTIAFIKRPGATAAVIVPLGVVAIVFAFAAFGVRTRGDRARRVRSPVVEEGELMETPFPTPTQPVVPSQPQEAPKPEEAPQGAAEARAAAPPSWVGSDVSRGEAGQVLVEIKSGRFATKAECLDDALRQAADTAHRHLQEDSPSRRVDWEVPLSFVQDRLVKEQYMATVDMQEYNRDWSSGPMYQAHLLVELSPESRAELHAMWREEVLGERLRWIGGGLAFVLVTLATAAGYLRLDDATKGYYSGRLKLAAVSLVALSGAALWTTLV